jgi:FkbM family methyltransferase
LAGTLPIIRRLWLGATAYQYRRARRLFEPAQVPAFALREGHARSVSVEPTVYTLRDSGLRVALRHGSSDSGVLEEIFNQDCYAFPAPVHSMLERLGRPPRILDLGGHIGFFALYVLGIYPDAQITSVEPDPDNIRVLEACVRLNELDGQWTLVRACAGAVDGTVGFIGSGSTGEFSRSHITSSSDPAQVRVPVRDVLPLIEDSDVVKVDIQGGEWEILQDPRLRALRPRAVVLEYHPYLCPEESVFPCAARLLTSAGYELGPHAEGVDGEGTLWAWARGGADAA